MKTLFLILVTVFSFEAFSAATLRCKDNKSDWAPGGAGLSKLRLECSDRNGYEYKVAFDGVGATLILEQDVMVIKCPFIKQADIYGDYYGLKLAVGFIGGATVGVSTGKKGRTCFLSGVFLGAGFEVDVNRMTISDAYAADYDEVVFVEEDKILE